jgi:glucan phosphoethanolaminetransferase (alkaline phosphatase superfamily)
MKTMINALSIISVVATVLGVLLLMLMSGADQRMSFIWGWFLGITFLFVLPLFGRAISLVNYRDKISPQKWIIIYSILVVLYIIGAIGFGFINHTRDLPMAIRRDFSTIEGEVQIVRNNDSSQRVRVFNQEFDLNRQYFYDVSRNNAYRIIYLPNSRHVIDVIAEDSRSLLRRRN